VEQTTNKTPGLTTSLSVYTTSICMGRPPKPPGQRRSKLFPLRLLPSEIAELEQASRSRGESIADILRKGAALYLKTRGKGGSQRKEKK